MEWWKKGVDLSQRIGDWAVPIFREHNKVADLSAGYGAKGHCRVWEDESAIDWTKATGMCGFLDGSCNDKVCGAGITISIFRQELGGGGVMRYKKCGLVERSNSLDAELGGCAMQIVKVSNFGCGNAESRLVLAKMIVEKCNIVFLVS